MMEEQSENEVTRLRRDNEALKRANDAFIPENATLRARASRLDGYRLGCRDSDSSHASRGIHGSRPHTHTLQDNRHSTNPPIHPNPTKVPWILGENLVHTVAHERGREMFGHRLGSQEPRQHDDSRDFKVEITEFDGKPYPYAFSDWLKGVKRVFELKDLDDDRKVKLVALKLRGYASLWWDNENRKREAQGRRNIRTWAKMKAKLTVTLLPPHHRQYLLNQMMDLFQRELTVAAYIQEFEHLILKCDLHDEEEITMARVFRGFKPKIRRVVKMYHYFSQRLALQAEKNLSEPCAAVVGLETGLLVEVMLRPLEPSTEGFS